MTKQVHPSRIRQFKKGFPPEDCPKCWGDESDCDFCKGEKKCQQILDKEWEPPKLNPGDKLVAYLDFDEWANIGVLHPNGDFTDTDFPFERSGFATARHMRLIGFDVDHD